MISSLTDDRSVVYDASASLNANVASAAMRVAMPSRIGQENAPELILTRRSAQVPPPEEPRSR